jgi:hypothetical protein
LSLILVVRFHVHTLVKGVFLYKTWHSVTPCKFIASLSVYIGYGSTKLGVYNLFRTLPTKAAIRPSAERESIYVSPLTQKCQHVHRYLIFRDHWGKRTIRRVLEIVAEDIEEVKEMDDTQDLSKILYLLDRSITMAITARSRLSKLCKAEQEVKKRADA